MENGELGANGAPVMAPDNLGGGCCGSRFPSVQNQGLIDQ
jgi:hypothetical protein